MAGSRFGARALRARDDEAARRAREEARELHHDATHHCYAVRPVEGEPRWDDDGEPSGTAGRPLLAAIRGAGLHNAAVVVTRWFGGTELGTGRLSRSYRRAAEGALDGLPSTPCRPGRRVQVSYDYDDTGSVMAVVEASGASRRGESYGDRARLTLEVAEAELDRLGRRLREATSGRAEVRRTGRAVLVPAPRSGR